MVIPPPLSLPEVPAFTVTSEPAVAVLVPTDRVREPELAAEEAPVCRSRSPVLPAAPPVDMVMSPVCAPLTLAAAVDRVSTPLV
jgi:hypothetical protein